MSHLPAAASEVARPALSDVLQLELRGVDGEYRSIASLAGDRATVVIFLGNGCPTVRAYEERLEALQSTRYDDGVRIVAFNSNNPHLSPPDTFPAMVKRASGGNFSFPYLKDDQGKVAKGFGAVCTPNAFVLDRDLNVVYRGRIDDSRLGDRISRRDLENAVADEVAGRPVAVRSTDPFGCSIVW
ncbi:MAG: thioredoxin family protein [Actinomycetota bacterium]